MSNAKIAVVDCLGRGSKIRRFSTLDAIGIGPRLVVGIIESTGHEAELFQCEEAPKAHKLKDFDAIFISGMSTDLGSVIKVSRLWRSKPIVVGGPSFVDYKALIRSGVKYVVWGEGEISIPYLLKALNENEGFEGVPNLIYKSSKGIIRNSGPKWAERALLWEYMPSVHAVTRYPWWWASRVYVEVVRGCSNFYRPTIPLADGRRCIFCDMCRTGPLKLRVECPVGIPPGCGYCSVPALFGPARSRPMDRVIQEVKELLKLGVRRVVLSAPDFLDYGRDWLVAPQPLTDPRNPPPNMKAIDLLLKKLTSLPQVLEGNAYIMIENVKPNLVTEEIAEVLGQYLKGTPVHLGLESGHPEHHIALGRPSRVEEVFRAIKLLKKEGLKPYVYVIHGLPGENNEVVKKTIDAVKKAWKLGAEKITLYRFTPLKGTAFEGYPRPPPAVKSRAKPLYELVKKLNTIAKKRLIGRKAKVIGVSKGQNGSLISYMLPHGPVVLVKGKKVSRLIGKTFEAEIIRARSDRVVEGRVFQ